MQKNVGTRMRNIRDWNDLTDELWVPDAEREYNEMQAINEEYPVPPEWETIKTKDWGWTEKELVDFWAIRDEIADSELSSEIFEKFRNNIFGEHDIIPKNVSAYIPKDGRF